MPHGKFEFQGKGLGYFWLWIWTTVLSFMTLGLFFPWAISAQQRWIAKKTFIDGKQLCFKGSGMGFFANGLLIIILSIITLGLYLPWGKCKIQRWITNNTYYADPGDIEHEHGMDSKANISKTLISIAGIVLIFILGLILFTEGSALAPFIYAIF